MPILEEGSEVPVEGPLAHKDPKTTLLEMLHHPDRTTVALALHAIRAHFPEAVVDLDRFRDDPHPLIREALA